MKALLHSKRKKLKQILWTWMDKTRKLKVILKWVKIGSCQRKTFWWTNFLIIYLHVSDLFISFICSFFKKHERYINRSIKINMLICITLLTGNTWLYMSRDCIYALHDAITSTIPGKKLKLKRFYYSFVTIVMMMP